MSAMEVSGNPLVTVTKKRRRKKSNGPKGSKDDSPESPTSSEYDTDTKVDKKSSHVEKKKSGASSSKQAPLANPESTDAPKPGSLPPINVILNDVNHTYPVLARLLKVTCKFPPTVTSQRSGAVSVRSSTLDDYHKILTVIESHNFEYFLYRSTETPPVKVVIRDLPVSMSVDDVKEDLEFQGFSVVSVAQLRAFRDKRPLPLFLVTLEPTAERTRFIYNVKSIMLCRARIVEYVKPKAPLQCHNCQRFHHISNLCHAVPRCVKCGLEHATSTCQKTPDLPAKCANCDESHTASYRGCRDFKKASKAPPKTQHAKAKAPAAKPRYIPAPLPTSNPWAPLATPETIPESDPMDTEAPELPETTSTENSDGPSTALQALVREAAKITPETKPVEKTKPARSNPKPLRQKEKSASQNPAPASVPPATQKSKPAPTPPTQTEPQSDEDKAFLEQLSRYTTEHFELGMKLIQGSLSRGEALKLVQDFTSRFMKFAMQNMQQRNSY